MLKPIADLNPTQAEREIAAAERWAAADLERGAFLIRYTKPLTIAGEPYSPWFKLMIPAATWPGGTLADLQADTGLYHWRPVLDGDPAAAVATAEKKLNEWFTEEAEQDR